MFTSRLLRNSISTKSLYVGMFFLLFGIVQADVSITVDFNGISQNKTISNIPWTPGMKVVDAMSWVLSESLLTYTLDSSSTIGEFVTSIDGVYQVSGTGPWWLFCVNGITSRVGIDHKLLHDEDIIEWHYSDSFPPCPTESVIHPGQHPEHAH